MCPGFGEIIAERAWVCDDQERGRTCELPGSCWEGGTAGVPCALGIGVTCVQGQMLREGTENILQLLRVPLWARCLLSAPGLPSCTRALEPLQQCCGQPALQGSAPPGMSPAVCLVHNLHPAAGVFSHCCTWILIYTVFRAPCWKAESQRLGAAAAPAESTDVSWS